MTSFRGERFFLSNFYPAPISAAGVEWPTVEHGYVYFKTLDPAERALVLLCRTPGEAKRLGRTVTLRPDWSVLQLGVMYRLLRLKFTQHRDLRLRLLQTGGETLIEENEWGDRFWGTCGGAGHNWLGQLLMRVRHEELEVESG
jgi:ribA/ribD-fused uncharacterized protein